MSNWAFRRILPASALALAGCGGGTDMHVVAWTPPPPTPAIIAGATTSQQFTAVGATHPWGGGEALLGAADQLQVRYVQSSNSYEVQLPHSQTWGAIKESAGSATGFEGAVGLTLRQPGYSYSNVISWSDGANYYGLEAIGVPTPASGVPITGSASYSGNFWGQTSETYQNKPVTTYGGVELAFDFAKGSLSGRLLPFLYYQATADEYSLPSVDFSETVYSTGSTSFSGKFDTTLAGVNSFSGLFTGPNAEELIGNFALPYQSPIDSQTYQSDGAFDGKKH